jgi:hypothetical protein
MKAKSTGFVAYYRVSTDRQGRSGLGLEAQRAAVVRYLAGIGGILLAEHTEVETGRRNDRPELQKPWRPAGSTRPGSSLPNWTGSRGTLPSSRP